MIDRVVGGSRYLALLAVVGSFVAAAIVQVYGLVRVVVNAYDAFVGRDYSDKAAKEVLVDAVSTIDLFLVGTILFVFAIGFYQLFIADVPGLPRAMRVSTFGELKARLVSVVIVALLVGFLGEVVEWNGTSTDILGYGLAIGAVILSLGFVTRYLEVGPAIGERWIAPSGNGVEEPPAER